MESYARLVRAWASRLDLVSAADLNRFEERHIADSLRALPLLDSLPPGPAADVGSGAGLPGVPLAVARPERHWRLLEPRRRRAAFLEEVVRELGLDAEVIPIDAQAAARRPDLAGVHTLAIARALAPPSEALRLLLPLVRRGGVAAIFVGSGAQIPPETEVGEEGLAIMRADGSPADNKW